MQVICFFADFNEKYLETKIERSGHLKGDVGRNGFYRNLQCVFSLNLL